ncbi:MAG TPA: hypothetical protein VI358_18075 [Pseudolabrys sp.]
MPIALSSIRDLLLPGLMEITGEYEQIPSQYKQIFETRQSKMALERSVQTRYVGLPQLKNEGAATQFDNTPGETFVYNMEVFEVALGYAITRKAIDDNLYKAQFKPTQLGLQRAFEQFKEIEAASILNNSTTVNTQLGGDGKALLATDHPIPGGGTVANTGATPLNLNESSLLSSMTAIRRNFVDDAGLKIRARARKLMVPPELEATAIRLTKTELRPGTANNDVNAILSLSGGLPDGYFVFDYFTSQYAWFLKTDIAGFIHLQRIPYESDMWVDNFTDNLLVKGYERYGYFYNDWRCCFGQYPTG